MNKASARKKVMKEMKDIFYGDIDDDKYIDWMGNLIDNENYPTYHHIEKREDLIKDGKDIEASLENGAYLGIISHQYLHEIEKINIDLYYSWNKLFRVINDRRSYLDNDVLNMINNLKKLSLEITNNDNKKTK